MKLVTKTLFDPKVLNLTHRLTKDLQTCPNDTQRRFLFEGLLRNSRVMGVVECHLAVYVTYGVRYVRCVVRYIRYVAWIVKIVRQTTILYTTINL